MTETQLYALELLGGVITFGCFGAAWYLKRSQRRAAQSGLPAGNDED
jgi:hypothetical protein